VHIKRESFSETPRPRSLSIKPYHNAGTHLDAEATPYPENLWHIPLGNEWPTPIEGDFHDDCYYAENSDDIVPELSLGMIETKYALPTRRPLPATFTEAELEALAPTPYGDIADGCISQYYAEDRVDEQLNTVRYSSQWPEVKDRLIFREFPDASLTMVNRTDILMHWRNRPDPYATITISRSSSPENYYTRAGAMNVDPMRSQSAASRRGSRQPEISPDDPLHNLEMALQQSRPSSRAMSSASRHSRASSVASGYSERLTRPKPLRKINDAQQDEVLRMLGVEGSPQAVYETPGPAFGPRPSSTHSSRPGSVSSAQRAFEAPPQHETTYNREYSEQNNGTNGHVNHKSTPASARHINAGRHDGNDTDATPRPKYNRTDSRKRSYEEEDHNGGRDDETPKQRYKQARVVPDAYRRRWS
jgi:hypothetical protein